MRLRLPDTAVVTDSIATKRPNSPNGGSFGRSSLRLANRPIISEFTTMTETAIGKPTTIGAPFVPTRI